MIKRSKYTDEELNSGLLEFGQDKHIREGGKLIETQFESVGRLNYKTMSMREADYSLYASIDKVITKKVKVYFVPELEKRYRVLLDGEKYDITSIDPDNERRFIYLYLERVSG